MGRTMNFNWPTNDLKARFLFDFFMISTLINGMSCEYSQSQSLERRVDNPGRYQVSLRNENQTIYNGNVLVTIGFDKMLHWVFDKEVEKGGRSCSERSFKLGHRLKLLPRRRLQFVLLPIMYKMGVMTTLLTGLTVLMLKGLTIGVILLIFAFGNYFTKFHKHSYQNSQPIHLHVHSQDGHSKWTSIPSYGSEVGLGPWDRVMEEPHPDSYLEDDNYLDSYRRRLIQNSAGTLRFKPLLWQRR